MGSILYIKVHEESIDTPDGKVSALVADEPLPRESTKNELDAKNMRYICHMPEGYEHG